jgi:NAD(P)-dependent dehydrogenase (short-subunit alcohol dehydrogenase family)
MDTQTKKPTMSDLSGKTTIVVGASRGLGRGIATAFAEAGAPVVAVARTATALAELANGSATIQPEVADAGDATVAGGLLDRYEPEVVILVAGARPLMRPLQHQTWETFSVNWHTDVRIAFHWLREALLTPLRPGSRVVVISSGAALAGSPLSGGYAGAKATQRFITGYAQDEAERAGLGITFTAVLPRITPLTDLGRPAGGEGVRRSQWPVRGAVPPADGRAAHPRGRRRRSGRAGTGRCRHRRPRLPADRRRAAEATLTQPTSRAPGQGYVVAQPRCWVRGASDRWRCVRK